MKIFRLSDAALIVGITLIIGPIYLGLPGSKWFWYVVILIGCALTATVGYGAQMEQMGKGNTGEELLKEIWGNLKSLWGKLRRTK